MLNEFGSPGMDQQLPCLLRPHQLQKAHMHRQCVSVCLFTLDKLLSASSIPSRPQVSVDSTRSPQYYPNLSTDGYILAPPSRRDALERTDTLALTVPTSELALLLLSAPPASAYVMCRKLISICGVRIYTLLYR